MRRVLTSREWASVALLSVIVPVGLLATFRLTGVLREPSKPKVITVETVTWTMSRPNDTANILEVLRNSYNLGIVSIDFNITLDRYDEQHLSYGSADILWLGINTNVALSDGFVHSVTVHFSEIDAYAFLDIDEDVSQFGPYNPTTQQVEDPGLHGRDAYVTTRSSVNGKQCILGTLARWVFTDQNNQHHRMRVTLEVVYQHGGTYREVDLPISLEVTVG